MNCARKKLRISVKKTRESFRQNTYMFFQKVVRVLDERSSCFFDSDFSILYTRLINGLIVRNLY